MHQRLLLLARDLVGLGGGVNAPFFHSHRLHTGGQQLGQRPLCAVIAQQCKIPGDAIVQLLFIQSRLEIQHRLVLVLFHISQMRRGRQRKRAADAEMREQHFSHFLKDRLCILPQRKGDIL